MAAANQGTGLQAIVMAGGKGTRLKSNLPKVLHPLLGKTLLARVLETLNPLFPQAVYVVVGHGREQVNAELQSLSLNFETTPVTQEPQLGTGHAVQQVKKAADQKISGSVLILSGDVPLLKTETLNAITKTHTSKKHDITLLAAELENPYGHGRVITKSNKVLRIVEEKDASLDEKAIKLGNTGLYCINWQSVSPLLDKLQANNAQKEFYLTDLIGLAVEAGLTVGTHLLNDHNEVIGINSRQDLARCTAALNERVLERLMTDGVTIIDPRNTLIAPEVSVGSDTVIHPGCYLTGNVTIGKRCQIGPQTVMQTSGQNKVSIGDDSSVLCSYVRDSSVGAHSFVGPYAQLRDNAQIADHVKIGNFVEVKNSTIDEQSFASHLAYVGDAKIGKDVNLGAGTITANFNALTGEKHQTIIEDHAKTGSNSVLVAPITIGHHAFVAAGSVVTKDVAPYALAVTRPKQTEIIDWVKKQLKP